MTALGALVVLLGLIGNAGQDVFALADPARSLRDVAYQAAATTAPLGWAAGGVAVVLAGLVFAAVALLSGGLGWWAGRATAPVTAAAPTPEPTDTVAAAPAPPAPTPAAAAPTRPSPTRPTTPATRPSPPPVPRDLPPTERSKTGAVRLALRTGAPIVPVAMVGAHDVVDSAEPRRLMARLARNVVARPLVAVTVGEPIDVRDLAGVDSLDHASEETIRRVADEVMGVLVRHVAQLRDDVSPQTVPSSRAAA